ncbi:acyltransferase family protein [Spirulina major]|uniref:acyltransferase family protein n=1 Tax=Spirulina major TaxID=270636 RepID=UPI0009346204|nr:acyltransferase family protein [Spirulina major]
MTLNPTPAAATPAPANNRILWIDNIRALGILQVLFVHTGRFRADWFVYVFSFFMPLFFFLSGLFVKDSLREKPFGPFLTDKFIRRLVPYFVFNGVSYLFWLLLIRPMDAGLPDTPPPIQPLVGIFYGVGGYGWLQHNISLWFLICLLVTEIAFYGLIRLPSKRHLIAVLGICAGVGYGIFFLTKDLTYQLSWIPYPLQYRLPWCLDLMLTAVVFYGAGYLCRNYVLSDRFTQWHRGWVVGGAIAAYIIGTEMNSTVNFILGNYGNFAYFYLGAFGGIFVWLHLSRCIPPNPVLKIIGQSSLTIYLLHLLIFPLITGVLILGLNIPNEALKGVWWAATLYTGITTAVLIPLHYLLVRYTPWLVGQRRPAPRPLPSS